MSEHSNKHTNCPIPIESQIAALVGLDDGWYDDSSRKYQAAHLRWLTSLVASVVTSHSLPTPYIYPTPEGLVRVEWSTPEKEVVATIDLANQSVEILVAVVRDPDAVHEHSISLKELGAEIAFGGFLSEHLPVKPPQGVTTP